MRILGALSLPFLLAACGDLDVRSVRGPGIAPVVLSGEWVGTWYSTRQATTGRIVIRAQDFAGEPLVNVELDNPCVEPRVYELLVTAATIELRADEEVVLAATIGANRRLDGRFQCALDAGTWTADWQRDLPPVVDLRGPWRGELVPAGGAATELRLDLQQGLREGRVQLDGVLDVPQLWPLPLLVTGTANFRADVFDLVLRTALTTGPQWLLMGVGDARTLRLEDGQVHVFDADPVPFRQGAFAIARGD